MNVDASKFKIRDVPMTMPGVSVYDMCAFVSRCALSAFWPIIEMMHISFLLMLSWVSNDNFQIRGVTMLQNLGGFVFVFHSFCACFCKLTFVLFSCESIE